MGPVLLENGADPMRIDQQQGVDSSFEKAMKEGIEPGGIAGGVANQKRVSVLVERSGE